MNDQLQDLLKRVYEEGVAKANAEAERILNDARTKADEIVSKAASEANELTADAEKKAADIKKNTDADLQMATNHTINAVKQKITDLVLSESLNAKLSTTFSDIDFVKKLILETLNAWKANMSSGSITISENMKPMLDEYYLKSLQDIFGGKLQVEFSPVMKHGFQISPSDGTYKLSFSDDDFANLFKTYLRPRTKEILFGT